MQLRSFLFLAISPALAFTPTPSVSGVTQDVYDALVAHVAFAVAVYLDTCTTLAGIPVNKFIANTQTDTQAYVATYNTKKEVVVAFRGTSAGPDWDTNINAAPINVSGPGLNDFGTEPQVHRGVQAAYNSVADDIIGTVRSGLAAKQGYSISVVGHSLGGALCQYAYVSLKKNFPNTVVKAYCSGGYAIGNNAFVDIVDSLSNNGKDFYRITHTDDGVPRLFVGPYNQTLTEYWTVDPPQKENVQVCKGRTDDNCNWGQNGSGINAAHIMYLGFNLVAIGCGLPTYS